MGKEHGKWNRHWVYVVAYYRDEGFLKLGAVFGVPHNKNLNVIGCVLGSRP